MLGIDLVNKLTELNGVLGQIQALMPAQPVTPATVYAVVAPVTDWLNALAQSYETYLKDDKASLFNNNVALAKFDAVKSPDVGNLVGFFGKLFSALRNTEVVFNSMSISSPVHDTLNFTVKLRDDVLGDPIAAKDLKRLLIDDAAWQTMLSKIASNLNLSQIIEGRAGYWYVPAAKVGSGIDTVAVNRILEGYALMPSVQKSAPIVRVFIDRGDGKEIVAWKKTV